MEQTATEQWRYRANIDRTSTGKISCGVTVEASGLGPDDMDQVIKKAAEMFERVDLVVNKMLNDHLDLKLGKDLEASIRQQEDQHGPA